MKYYSKEHENFKEAYEIKLSDFEATTIFSKLQAHYKLPQALTFRGAVLRGNCGRWEIKIPHNTCLGLLVHEIAHAIQLKKGWEKGQKWHTKRHTSIMKKVLKFVNHNKDRWISTAKAKEEQKNETYWKQKDKEEKFKEFKKTPEYKLQIIRQRIKQWESKKKRAESYLKKLYRKKKYYEKVKA